MTSFGFDILISLLLPGSVIASSLGVLVWRFGQHTQICEWAVAAAANDLLLSVIALVFSALLGGMLASLLEIYEWTCMDLKVAKAIGVSNEQYDEEWYCYVESLSESGNRYLSWKARFFFFQFRTGAALLVFAISWAVAVPGIAERIVGSLVCLALAIALLVLGGKNHELLATWRHRIFGEKASANLAKRAV